MAVGPWQRAARSSSMRLPAEMETVLCLAGTANRLGRMDATGRGGKRMQMATKLVL